MKIIKPSIVYKCRTHKILPGAIWGTEETNGGTEHFYYYSCPSCPDEHMYYYLAYGPTKVEAELNAREFWNEMQ